MSAWFQEFQSRALILAPKALSIYIAVWAIRYRAEIDKPLDLLARNVRRVVVLICWCVMSLPPFGKMTLGLRYSAAVIGGAAFWWPNSVFNVMKYLRRREFAHVGTTLRRWNPMDLPVETESDRMALEMFDVYIPRILDLLQRGRGVVEISGALADVRQECSAEPNVPADRAVAESLVRWWASGRRVALAA